MELVWRKDKPRYQIAVFLFAVALTPASSILAKPAPPAKPVVPAPPELNILFIGNSLTYANDLPGTLEKLLDSAGFAVGSIEAVAYPNFGLQDHWLNRRTRRQLRSKPWDVVVLQQGPSATEGRPSLLEYSAIFAAEIRKRGAQPGLYMVWPSRQRDFDFDGVSESYRMAAEQVDGWLFPVGEAWRAAWSRAPQLPLYGHDGFHPSRLGSLLAALVLSNQLANVDLQDPAVSQALVELGVPAPVVPLLTQAAEEAIQSHGRQPANTLEESLVTNER